MAKKITFIPTPVVRIELQNNWINNGDPGDTVIEIDVPQMSTRDVLGQAIIRNTDGSQAIILSADVIQKMYTASQMVIDHFNQEYR